MIVAFCIIVKPVCIISPQLFNGGNLYHILMKVGWSQLLAKQLVYFRKRKGVTQQEVADALGFSRATYAHYEIGRREPDNEMLQKLADYFGTSTDSLLGRKDTLAHAGHEGSIVSSTEDTRKIPIYDIGNRDEIFAQTNIIGYVPISADIMADYAISMNDDSMLPSIKPEAKVIIRAQETFSNGQAVLAQLPEGTYTIRRATQTDEGGIILTPDNSSYAPQHYNSANLRILGIVTHLITDFT